MFYLSNDSVSNIICTYVDPILEVEGFVVSGIVKSIQ